MCGVLQQVAPHTSPLFVSSVRLLPAGIALIAWAAASGRQQPKGGMAWLAIALFGLVDGAIFQVPQLPHRQEEFEKVSWYTVLKF